MNHIITIVAGKKIHVFVYAAWEYSYTCGGVGPKPEDHSPASGRLW